MPIAHAWDGNIVIASCDIMNVKGFVESRCLRQSENFSIEGSPQRPELRLRNMRPQWQRKLSQRHGVPTLEQHTLLHKNGVGDILKQQMSKKPNQSSYYRTSLAAYQTSLKN